MAVGDHELFRQVFLPALGVIGIAFMFAAMVMWSNRRQARTALLEARRIAGEMRERLDRLDTRMDQLEVGLLKILLHLCGAATREDQAETRSDPPGPTG